MKLFETIANGRYIWKRASSQMLIEFGFKSGVIKVLLQSFKNAFEFSFPPYNFLAGIYLFKVNNRNTKSFCRSGVFIVNFEKISQIVLVFPLLNLKV